MFTLTNVLLSGVIGGATGLVAHLIRNNKVLVLPKRRQRPFGLYFGFIADFFIGALAAVFATTYLFNPSDIRELLGISIMAGMAAENVLLNRELNAEKTKSEELDKLQQRLIGKK